MKTVGVLAGLGLFMLMGCATQRPPWWQHRKELFDREMAAEIRWLDCQNDPTCTGDRMFKLRTAYMDAKDEHDRFVDQIKMDAAWQDARDAQMMATMRH